MQQFINEDKVLMFCSLIFCTFFIHLSPDIVSVLEKDVLMTISNYPGHRCLSLFGHIADAEILPYTGQHSPLPDDGHVV